MDKLKPCPFCGGKAVVHVDNGVYVICSQCECRTVGLRDGVSQGRYTGGAVPYKNYYRLHIKEVRNEN